jgi:opacity protein-like surface antigen
MKWVYALLLIGAAGSASAQSADGERGVYVGARVGVAKYPARPKLIVGDLTFVSKDTREEDLSWGFDAGYRFSKHFGFEVGYLDLGEGTASMVDTAGLDVRGDLRFSVRGETLGLVTFFPIGRKWEPYGKLGVLFQDVDFRFSGTQAGVPFRLSSSSNREGKLYLETGVSYRFDEHWKASLGLTHLSDIGDKDRTGRADIRNVFLGLTHQF